MTIPAAPNSVSFSQIQAEMGGSNPISLSEYYAGGGLTKSNIGGFAPNGIPTSGTISVNDFRGAQNIGETHTSTLTFTQATNFLGETYYAGYAQYNTGSSRTNAQMTQGSYAPSFQITQACFTRTTAKGGSTTDVYEFTGGTSPLGTTAPIANSDTGIFKTLKHGSMTLNRSQGTFISPVGSLYPSSPASSFEVKWPSTAPGFSMDTSTSGTRTLVLDCI